MFGSLAGIFGSRSPNDDDKRKEQSPRPPSDVAANSNEEATISTAEEENSTKVQEKDTQKASNEERGGGVDDKHAAALSTKLSDVASAQDDQETMTEKQFDERFEEDQQELVQKSRTASHQVSAVPTVASAANNSDASRTKLQQVKTTSITASSKSNITSKPVIQQERDDSPLKYGKGPRQYCLVEMRRSEGGKRHLNTFVTCALAEKSTNISRELIQNACLSGGGVVSERYFRFVDEKGQELSKEALQSVQKQSHHTFVSEQAANVSEQSAATMGKRKEILRAIMPNSVALAKGSSDTTDIKRSGNDASKRPSQSSLSDTVTEKDSSDESDEEVKYPARKVTALKGTAGLGTAAQEVAMEKPPVHDTSKVPFQLQMTTAVADMDSDVIDEGMERATAVAGTKGSPNPTFTQEAAEGIKPENEPIVSATVADTETAGDGRGMKPSSNTSPPNPSMALDMGTGATNTPLIWTDTSMASKKRLREDDLSSDNRQPTEGKKVRHEIQSSGDKNEAHAESAVAEEDTICSTKEKTLTQSSVTRTKRPRNDALKDVPIQTKMPRKIRGRNLTTGWEGTFDSFAEAAIETNIQESRIKRACLDSGGTVGSAFGSVYFCFVTDRHEQPVSSEKSAASKEGGPIPPYTFDVSTLLPVKKSSSATPVKPPKVIELVDKGTNLVLCCFRGVTKAHRALNVERSFATMACLNYGTPFQPDLGDYILRYAPNQDAPLSAYDYGAHPGDYKEIKETHQARLARWARATNMEKAARGRESILASNQRKLQTIQKGGGGGWERRVSEKDKKETAAAKVSNTAIRRREQQALPITIGEAAAGNLVSLDAVSVPEIISNDTDTSMLCIICQGKTADVVFEPCHHCVLCSRCSETTCRTFCPSCRTTITARLQPSSIRVVQPRIYNSYSFM